MSLPARRRIWNFFESIFHHEITEEAATLAPQPPWIQTPLLTHQQASLHAALNLEGFKTGGDVGPIPGDPIGGKFNTTYGILGDRVGSGKSLIALSLVKQPTPARETVEYVWRPNSYVGDNTMGIMRPRASYTEWGTTLRDTSAALFVIPHALMNQWKEYVQHDTQGLRVHFVQRRSDATAELTDRIREGALDAVFVSSTMWRVFEEVTESTQFVWSRLFIDEADSVTVSLRWGAIHARFFWLITGSW
jgi:SNF2-related domain